MAKAKRKLCGQPSIGPSGVCVQSRARMSVPISPPPMGHVGNMPRSASGMVFASSPAKNIAALARVFYGHRSTVYSSLGSATGRTTSENFSSRYFGE
jgi:hypothetical protein